ncbi:sigma factor [Streptomyces sp. NPDC001351]|uniref:sigma factor n=1 Tax=Streptomyces sp. NPDC001351 TaxID=3364564 RepID=UPI0036B28725
MEERLPCAEVVRETAFAESGLPEVEALRVAMTLTARPADAEDLVRDTLLRTRRAIDRCDAKQPRGRLLTLMSQAGVDRRRVGASSRLGGCGATGSGLLTMAGTGRQLQPVVVGDAFHDGADSALDTHPLKYRQVVRLADIDRLSYAVHLAAARLVPGRGVR